MLKPNEVKFTVKSNYTDFEIASLEMQFDSALKNAETTGEWPAVVRQLRDGMSPEAVDEIAKRYRANGWRVDVGARGTRALLHHPIADGK